VVASARRAPQLKRDPLSRRTPREHLLPQSLDSSELPQRAGALAPGLVEYAAEFGDDISKDIRPTVPPSAASATPPHALFLEALLFLLHVTDRLAYQLIGDPNRRLFMDELLSAVQREVAAGGLLNVVLEEAYSEKQFYYQQFKHLHDSDGQPQERSLCRQFGFLMATYYGDSNAMGAAQVAVQALHAVRTLLEILLNPQTGVVAGSGGGLTGA
jgi:hypothetical protein